MADHPAERVEEIEVDYTEVDYSWGDGPVSSMIAFLRQGVTRFRLLASSSNYDALKGLLGACHVPGFELSFNGVTEDTRAITSPTGVSRTASPEPQPPSDPLDILEVGISDVGYWRRWVADLPEWVQLEFGGVQLATPRTDMSLPRPIQSLALRFIKPSSVAFIVNGSDWEQDLITRGDLEADVLAERSQLQRGPSPPTELTADWPLLLLEEKIGPLAVRSDMFTFQDIETATAIMADAEATHVLIGLPPTPETWAKAPARIAFWAGSAGAVFAAEAMKIFSDTSPISRGDIARMHDVWFDYWNQYWRRRGHQHALPADWACEATIPTKDALE